MERRKRNGNELENLKKRLEMKINEHKMLTNTLHEAFKREGTSEETLNSIKSAIDSTVSEINILREEINNGGVTYATYNTYRKISFFDKIGKKEKEPIKALSGCEPKYNRNKPYVVKSFDEIVKQADKEYEVKHTSITNDVDVDSILFTNRFLCDLSVIGVPETMVKWVCQHGGSDKWVEVQIYDFVDDNGTPVLSKLNYQDKRKFTFEIRHLDPTGCVVYIEKYNGCLVDEIFREALTYEKCEPSVIMLRIHYDGVSYEAGR